MTWRRTAAICLLVFCLSVSATFHFASLLYPAFARDQHPQPKFSTPWSELALVLANKIENPCGPELTAAVFSQLDFLRVFGANGRLLRLATECCPPGSVESATEIRGPPQSVLS